MDVYTTQTEIVDKLWDKLSSYEETLLAIDPRLEGVLWPIRKFQSVKIILFQQTNMCLLAQDGVLQINEQILSDIFEQMGQTGSLDTCINWFWIHQLVHITQGLGYAEFRGINKNTDRLETMRADLDADFLSIKTLALINIFEAEGIEGLVSVPMIRKNMFDIFANCVLPMLEMRPNIFIPFQRGIEIKRIISLICYHILTSRLTSYDKDLMLNNSLFINYIRDTEQLYLWYGQTSLLGRKVIKCPASLYSNIETSIRENRFDETYSLIESIALPAPEVFIDQCARSV